MTCNIQLQRDAEVFFSSIDLNNGAPVINMKSNNTWKVEVLAGFAFSQGAATQDISTLESGTTPDRASARFRTAINAAEWNLQCYMRPTRFDNSSANWHGGVSSSNVKPIADWMLWQMLIGNVAPHNGSIETSAWEGTSTLGAGAVYRSVERTTSANVVAQRSNFPSLTEMHMYIKADNIVYQLANATVNQLTIDAAIDAIATDTWSGFATNLVELRGVIRDNAIAVFGGTNNLGTSITANANAFALNKVAQYHPWAVYNAGGVATTARFIKNRLTTIDLHYDPGTGDVQYTFPVTAMSFTWNNNGTYLTPEELSALNIPIGQFAGTREITGTLNAYLRHPANQTAQFLRDILGDPRTSSAASANANIKIGGATSPFVALYLPSVQFDIPTHAVEDVIGISIAYKAQEPLATCGQGGELSVFVAY